MVLKNAHTSVPGSAWGLQLGFNETLLIMLEEHQCIVN